MFVFQEEQNAGTSANYDVELIHSAAAHHEVDGLSKYGKLILVINQLFMVLFLNVFNFSAPIINTSGEDVFCKPPVTLKWCTPKASTLQGSLCDFSFSNQHTHHIQDLDCIWKHGKSTYVKHQKHRELFFIC